MRKTTSEADSAERGAYRSLSVDEAKDLNSQIDGTTKLFAGATGVCLLASAIALLSGDVKAAATTMVAGCALGMFGALRKNHQELKTVPDAVGHTDIKTENSQNSKRSTSSRHN